MFKRFQNYFFLVKNYVTSDVINDVINNATNFLN